MNHSLIRAGLVSGTEKTPCNNQGPAAHCDEQTHDFHSGAPGETLKAVKMKANKTQVPRAGETEAGLSPRELISQRNWQETGWKAVEKDTLLHSCTHTRVRAQTHTHTNSPICISPHIHTLHTHNAWGKRRQKLEISSQKEGGNTQVPTWL